ncbi:MAG TPA: MlaD family protein [Chitinophagaceae bacterium]|nr:MlaD family protein [Chitinophagaceae bacterium]
MPNRKFNNIRLGVFVLAGLLFLILLLYMIGKKRNMFGSNFLLKARFENVQGLRAGNNVRYSGIEVGTVKRVQIINDTVIEVDMIIDNKVKGIIRRNAVVSIGTDGFVGNKIVNIIPVKQAAAMAGDNDLLPSKKPVDTDEMIRTLYKTNNDISIISGELKNTVSRINNSTALWDLLNDKGLPKNLKASALNIRLATSRANEFVADLNEIIIDVKNGKGSVGALLSDTLFAKNLNEAVLKIKSVGNQADSLAAEINKLVTGVEQDVNTGNGVIHSVLKDSMLAIKLTTILDHIEKGTDAFNQNMEALKQSSLLRGYFRKLEKEKQKEEKANANSQ